MKTHGKSQRPRSWACVTPGGRNSAAGTRLVKATEGCRQPVLGGTHPERERAPRAHRHREDTPAGPALLPRIPRPSGLVTRATCGSPRRAAEDLLPPWNVQPQPNLRARPRAPAPPALGTPRGSLDPTRHSPSLELPCSCGLVAPVVPLPPRALWLPRLCAPSSGAHPFSSSAPLLSLHGPLSAAGLLTRASWGLCLPVSWPLLYWAPVHSTAPEDSSRTQFQAPPRLAVSLSVPVLLIYLPSNHWLLRKALAFLFTARPSGKEQMAGVGRNRGTYSQSR